MIRSLLAILAGVATLTAISFGIEAIADPLLMALFPVALPRRSALSHNLPATLFGFVYGSLSVAAGGYVTGWIAARAPVLHSAVMGGVQILLTIWAAAAMWNHSPAINWIVTLIVTMPAALLGGWLFAHTAGRQVLRSTAHRSG
ncbi:MAG TPA: hypothetical protein VN730_14655 [Steroidobacteraceae bacterium]|nr:hypothetical protein [Steroidobacteraceae bacterium]